MLYELIVDGCNASKSMSFHKIIECDEPGKEELYLNDFVEKVISEHPYEFGEIDEVGAYEYTDTEHKAGDEWVEESEYID